jgi:uncharacterized protein YqjF (DUF2071 family)
VTDVVRQCGTTRHLDHRPWPLPRGYWRMGQTWHDLLFAHWRVEPERLRAVVPAEIPLDVRDGWCWVGVTPFEITGLRAPLLPPLPWISRFAEINVRTYTTIGGKPGIWFLSLDAARLSAVLAARRTYRLPYFHARIRIHREDGRIGYRARRASRDSPEVRFEASYGPDGPPGPAAPGSLEAFLVERYCLYALDGERRVHRADIHHAPWSICAAQAEIRRNTMARPYGFALDEEPLLHLAPRNDVLIWPLRPVKGSAP